MKSQIADPAALPPRLLRTRFQEAILVCKACEERSKGPKKIKARAVAKALRKAAHEAGWRRPRVVLTSCLGACPKKAYTVAAARPGQPITMLAFAKGDSAAAAVAALVRAELPP